MLNHFSSVMYDILNRNSKSKRNISQMEYYTRSLTLINRPAFVVPESAAASDNFRFRIQDLESCRFTSIPYAFLDRSGWSDIRRGIMCAETELKAGESRRVVPFSTNTSKASNDILQQIVFKGVHVERTLISTSSSFLNDVHNEDDSNDDGSDSSDENSIDEMYEDGLDTNQFQFLTNI